MPWAFGGTRMAYVWNIPEGTSKANFFPDTSIIEMGFV